METIRQYEGISKATLPEGPLHLAIGIFDGVHLGHRSVIGAAVAAARVAGGLSGVLTFAPHPSAVLRPDQPTLLLMNRTAKARVLGHLGVGALITEPFTTTFAQKPAEAFLPWLKGHLPQLAAVYVGENWRFGQGRKGDVRLLREAGRSLGLEVHSAPRVNFEGEPVSSSRIRSCLAAGEIAKTNSLLGYTYFAEGVVTRGKQLGRTIGFPTLNIGWAPELRPRFGVYVVRVRGAKSAEPLRGVANYGLRPTVEQSSEPRLEVHLLDDCPYDAGDEIAVDWLEFVRPEMKFAGLPELRQQIARDRDVARGWQG